MPKICIIYLKAKETEETRKSQRLIIQSNRQGFSKLEKWNREVRELLAVTASSNTLTPLRVSMLQYKYPSG
jgi:hypothetical protein